ncbi:hypothetical protein C0584_04945 [Candidatus Parcubacteria bacterium]|nr:MAG: hypothetical protein C0584_04945 [Candidatus Parcubacteria bacterium]
MKTILVDAINAFIDKEEGVLQDMYKILEEFPNRKIIVSGANDEEMKKFKLFNLPYEFFTLKHKPEKTDVEYYKNLLKKFSLKSDDVIYFEHNQEAVESARSLGILSYFYDKDKKDLESLKKFLKENL